MKRLIIPAFFLTAAVWGQQQALPVLPPDTVVARIDGKPITAGELTIFLQANPPEAQKNFLQNGQAFIERLALIRKLAELGEKQHLDQQPEVKQAIDLFRMNTLANAEVSAAQDAIPVSGADQKKYYEDHRDRFTQAKVKVLLVSFRSGAAPAQADPKAKKYPSEAEAKAKIEKVLGQVRSGADFVKMVKENSDDADSVARNGDFETPILRSDKLPQEVKDAIFALKPGQVSEPVRFPSGFYLFRLEALSAQPYEQVRDQIFIDMRQERFNEWLEKTRKGIEVKIENPDFFKAATGSAAGSN